VTCNNATLELVNKVPNILKRKSVRSKLAQLLIAISSVVWFYPFRLGAIGFDDIGNTLALLDPHQGILYRALEFTAANRWRPVYSTLALIEASIFGKHYEYYFWFNVFLLFIISLLVYRLAVRLSSSIALGLAIALIFLTSRDSYYAITQTLGLLELLGLLFLVLLTSAIVNFENSGDTKYLGFATLYYFLIVHTHERFGPLVVFLIPLVLTSGFLTAKKKIFWTGAFAAPLIFNISMKHFLFNMPLLVGTGQATTLGFTWKSAFQFFNQGILNVFGVSNGPYYLDGLVFQAGSGPFRYASVALLVISVLVLLGAFVAGAGVRRTSIFVSGPRRHVLLGVILIIVLVVSVSVTIRVEPRFLYAPTMIFLLLFAYCVALIARQKNLKIPAVVLVFAFLVTSLTLNKMYSNNESGVYFMYARSQTRQIVETTVAKFSQQLQTRPVFVLDPTKGDNWQLALAPTIMANSDVTDVKITTVTTLLDIPFGEHPIVFDAIGGLHTLNFPSTGYGKTGDWYGNWVGKTITIFGACQNLTLDIHPFRPGPRFHTIITTRGQKPTRYPLHQSSVKITFTAKQYGGSLQATFNRLYIPKALGLGTETHPVAAQVYVHCTAP